MEKYYNKTFRIVVIIKQDKIDSSTLQIVVFVTVSQTHHLNLLWHQGKLIWRFWELIPYSMYHIVLGFSKEATTKLAHFDQEPSVNTPVITEVLPWRKSSPLHQRRCVLPLIVYGSSPRSHVKGINKWDANKSEWGVKFFYFILWLGLNSLPRKQPKC